jgi:O-acetylhomoserine/O-acetylserine sulfhydrylase-like pyridoxal-dependent enzyme
MSRTPEGGGFLAEHRAVAWVSYPIFEDSPTRSPGRQVHAGRPGAVFTFGLEGASSPE